MKIFKFINYFHKVFQKLKRLISIKLINIKKNNSLLPWILIFKLKLQIMESESNKKILTSYLWSSANWMSRAK